MSKNPSHLEKALALCRQYLKHLESNPDTNPIHSQKKSVVKSLLRAQNPTEIIRLLGVKKFDSKLANYSKILRQSRTSRLNFLLKGFLVFITFPIAIPALMIWSWRARGTTLFLKTDGSILVDHLIALYEQSAKQDKETEPNIPLKKATTDNPAQTKGVAAQPKPSGYGSEPTPVKSFAQSIQSSPVATKQTMLKPQTYIPASMQTPITRPAFPSTSFTKPNVQSHKSRTTQPGVTHMLKKVESKSPQLTETDRQDLATQGLANLAGSLHQAFFGDPDTFLYSDLNRYTGRPLIIASRVRPSEAPQDYFSIDVCCQFKWCLKKPQTLTVGVLTNFDYDSTQKSFAAASAPVAVVKRQPPQKSGFSFTGLLSTLSLWTPPPTFASLMQQGHNIQGFDDKEELYDQAYKMASNDSEHILALEAMVNLLDDYCEHIRNWSYCSLRDDIAGSDFSQRPLDEQNAMLLRKSRLDQHIQINQDKSNDYLAKLPIDYRRQTRSANAIDDKFRKILTHLQNNNAGLAWSIFSRMPRLTPFIKMTFPNLMAMWHQIDGIFQLIDGDGYTILPNYSEEPLDSDLRKNRLSIYLLEGVIWCATINHQNEIDRFVIQPEKLGCDAEKTLERLIDRHLFEKEIKAAIYRGVFDRGYYPANETGPIGASIEAACNEFIEAHQWLEKYRQSLIERPPLRMDTAEPIGAHVASLAHRLQTGTIQPLQQLMHDADVANKTTSLEERRDIATYKIAENRRKLIEDDWSKAHLQFSPETWDKLLARNNTMNREEWDEFLGEYNYENEKQTHYLPDYS